MRPTQPRAFWTLFTFVNGVALAMLLASSMRGSVSLAALVVVMLLALAFEASPAVLNEDMSVALTVVVVFTAIAYGGAPLAVGAACASGAVTLVLATSDRLIKGMYNLGMHIVEAFVAAVVFALVTGGPILGTVRPDESVAGWELTAGLLLAGLAYTVVNSVLLGGAVHLASGVPLWNTVTALVRELIPLSFFNVGLAAVALVVLESAGPVALVLLTVPVLMARQSLQSVQDRQEAFDRMVRAFVKAIEVKDGYTRGHAERVADLSVLVAEQMGLSYEDRHLIRYGAILHDVGKIGVSLGILCKAGPLTDDEFDEMKLHPTIGAEMLSDIDFLQPALAIVRHHHERMDGRGYPDGLTGQELPLLTRVVTAVDAFDAMTSTRSYRRALPVSVALEELEANAGTQFDPEVVAALMIVVAEHGWEVTDRPVQTADAVGHVHHGHAHARVEA